MTRWGRLAGLLAAMLLPILVQTAAPQVRAFAMADTASLAGTDAMAAVAKLLLFLPVGGFAGMAVFLIQQRRTRWCRVSAEYAQLDKTSGETPFQPLFDPQPTGPTTVFATPGAAPELAPGQAPGPAQGADLAARARIVAMNFAFPDMRTGRSGMTEADGAGWPLQMACLPLRFTLTLRHAALAYRLEFCNRGAQMLGPLIIRADVVGGARLAPHQPFEFAAETLPLCHYLDSLPAGETIAVTGELRLPLAGIAAVRLGTAELLVPLMRVCAASAGTTQTLLSVSAGFAIGLPPLSPGGGIQPFRLDTGPGIWRKLTSRRLIGADLA